MTTEEHLACLHPVFREKVAALLRACDLKGCPMKITQSHRSAEIQAALFAQGREPLDTVNAMRAKVALAPISEENARVVTHAAPGFSLHEFEPCLAADFAYAQGHPYKEDGQSVTWVQFGELGESFGLTWGGRWAGKKQDRPHLQWTGGLTLAQLRAGERPPTSA